MSDDSLNLDKIDQPMREQIRQYVTLVRELAGVNARSMTLFGAIVAGTFDARRHTVSSVLVLGEVDLELLRSLSEHGAKLGKSRISAPLIMTSKYIQESLDTFPLELIEIQQMHLTVFGDDAFTELHFQDEHVRLQCERESKTILIGLRQGLLAAAGREKVLEAVELDIGQALLRTMRGALWVRGKKDAKKAVDVVADVEKSMERKLPGIRTALDHSAEHQWKQFKSLYQDVEALAEFTNA